MNLPKVAQNSLKFLGNHVPEILTGIGIGGVVVTAFFAGKGTLVADQKLKEYEETRKKAGVTTQIDWKEKLKLTWKYYTPAIFAGLGTALSIFMANRVSAKQLATVMTVATTTQKVLTENREAVKEVFGEKGLRKVDEKINETNAAQYFNNVTHVYETGRGTSLCCEGFLTGMLFRANREWVRKCVNDFNARLIAGERLSYNDFIQTLIPTIDPSVLPAAGDLLGYNLDVRRHLLEIVEDSFLTYDSSEAGYIFKLREMPLLNYAEYY